MRTISIQSSTTITTKITINMQIQNKRTDIASHESFDIEELLKFAIKDGKLILPVHSYDGRCYYVKYDHIEDGIKRKSFDRILKRPLTEEEKETLQKYER